MYYGKGRAAGVKPTLELQKRDGLGQGKVLSTALWNVCHKYILAAVREKLKDDGIDCAFIDDLTQMVSVQQALATYDATVAALLTAGECMNMGKLWVEIPLARNEAEKRENEVLIAAFLQRGVKPTNILSLDHASVDQQGFELLGVPHGTDALKALWIDKLVSRVASDGAKVSAMSLSFPSEAIQILVTSLSKRLGFAARQCTPTSNAAKALTTAHKHSLSVVANICGCNEIQTETEGEAGLTQNPPLPPFAIEICGLKRPHGGMALQPLDKLASTGVLHLAVLAGAVPKLLERLLKPNSGQASADLAAEIANVDHSALPWAVQARTVYARVKAALAELSAEDKKLLKELLPEDADAGKTSVWPTLLEMVTTGYKHCQEKLSHALSEREFLRVYKAYQGQPHRYMLRQGTAAGATAFLQPAVAGLTDNHTSATGRMQPHILRMALRDMLGMEPIPGTQVMLQRDHGRCPSCKEALDSPMLDAWVVTQHLISCSSGPFWNKTANAITAAVAQNFADVGVKGTTETAGLSEISAHRPGDFTSVQMTGPVSFDAGGLTRYAVDTTVKYCTATSLQRFLSGHQQMEVTAAEKGKEKKLRREVEEGKRTALPQGYTFVPAGISVRGVMGAGMVRLHEWLADYGAKNRGVLTYLGEEGANVKANLLQRWTQRLSVAIHRATMAVWYRVQDIQKAQNRAGGGRREAEALTGIEIRFGGSLTTDDAD